MREGHLRGALPRTPTARQVDVLAAFVATGGSVPGAAALVGVRPSTAKRHLADLRARSGLSTEQLIYRGRAEGWLVIPALEPGHRAVAWRLVRSYSVNRMPSTLARATAWVRLLTSSFE